MTNFSDISICHGLLCVSDGQTDIVFAMICVCMCVSVCVLSVIFSTRCVPSL